jgi:GNAT superfamily N-acetyltransferase
MWRVELTPAQYVDAALTRIVTGGEPEISARLALRELRAYLASAAAGRWMLWWARNGAPDSPTATAAAVVIHSPGRTALVLHSSTARGAVSVDALAAVLSAAAQDALAQGAIMVQVLLEPSAQEDVQAFVQAGFIRQAELIYLRLSLRGRTPAPDGVEFLAYAPATHAAFARAIAASYAGSLDCPAMEGLRDVEDAIAAHKVAGVFRPDLWTLATIDGEPAGILLLNENLPAAALEVVYMGVAAKFRGRHLGRALLARAAAMARREQFSALCLAVDAANRYAFTLYLQEGFVETFRKLAYMRK